MITNCATASEVSLQVERILMDINWKPDKIITNECGAIYFVWDKSEKYADIECTPKGDVLYGLTDFKNVNIVNDLTLNISSFLSFKKEYENMSQLNASPRV